VLFNQFAQNIRYLSACGVDVGEHPLIGWLGVAGAGEDSHDDSLRIEPGPHDDHSAGVGCHTGTVTARRPAGVNVLWR